MSNLTNVHVTFVHPATIALDVRLLKTTSALLEMGAHITIFASSGNTDRGALDPRITIKAFPALFRAQTAEPSLSLKGRAREWLRNHFLDLPLFKPVHSRFARGIARSIAEEHPAIVCCINWATVDIGLELARKGLPLVYETYEYSPAVIAHPSLAYSSRFIHQRIKAEQRLICKAATTIVVADEIAGLYREQAPQACFITIYNVAPQDSLPPTPVHRPLRLYFQSMIRSQHGIDRLIEALSLIADKDFILDIQGKILDQEFAHSLQKQIDRTGLSNQVRLVAPCKFNEVVKAANDYDLGVHLIPKCIDGFESLNNIYSLPNKLFAYTSAGLGLVLPDFLVAAQRLLKESSAVTWVDEKDLHQVAAAFEKLIGDPDKVQEMKQASFEWAQRYSTLTEQKKIVALYEALA